MGSAFQDDHILPKTMDGVSFNASHEETDRYEERTSRDEDVKKPRKRFIGRRTADAQAAKDGDQNKTIENGGALDKGMLRLYPPE